MSLLQPPKYRNTVLDIQNEILRVLVLILNELRIWNSQKGGNHGKENSEEKSQKINNYQKA